MDMVLRTTELSKRYGRLNALKDANIAIPEGEIYGLVGKNGAGKTTLMKLVTGLSRPSSGELELFGQRKCLAGQRRRLGVIIETPEFFPYFDARKNLEYFRIQHGICDKNVVPRVLEEVGLADVGKKKFKAYSLGMKQRLGIALALMGEPDFLILDEPINGIDPAAIVELRRLLLRLNREKHITIMISSHILSELSHLATRFAIIDQGVIVEELSAETLSQKSGGYVEIRVDQPGPAVAALEEEMGLTNYQIEADGSIRLFEGLEKTREIAKLLACREVGFSAIQCHTASLEDYFLFLVGGENQDGRAHKSGKGGPAHV